MSTRSCRLACAVLTALFVFFGPAAAQQAPPPAFDDPVSPDLPSQGPMPLVTILYEFGGYPPIAWTRDDVRDEIYGCDADPTKRCMNGYWRESSYGQFEFTEALTTDWIPAWDIPETGIDEGHYTFWFGPNDDGVGYPAEADGGFLIRFWALMSLYQQDWDFYGFFKSFDTDNDDVIVLGKEVALMIVENRPNCGGQTGYDTDDDPADPSYAIEGLTFVGGIANVAGGEIGGCGPHFQPFYIYAHEIGHALWGNPYTGYAVWDTYGGGAQPEPTLHYTLYGGDVGPLHLPTLNKLKLGWLEPYTDVQVVQTDGWYTIPNVELNPTAFLLHQPSHGKHEYFLVENRYRPNTYEETALNDRGQTPADRGMVDQGLVVWHVDETKPRADDTPGAITRMQLVPAQPPTGAAWTDYVGTAWNGWDNSYYSLHDGSAPTDTRWWDGTASGVGIWDVGNQGADMVAFLDGPGPGLLIHRAGSPFRSWFGTVSRLGEPASYYVPVTYTGDSGTLDVEWIAKYAPAGVTMDTPPSVLPARSTVLETVSVTNGSCANIGQQQFLLAAQSTDGTLYDEAQVTIQFASQAIPDIALDTLQISIWPTGDEPDIDDIMIPSNPRTVNFTGVLNNAGNVPGEIDLGWERSALPSNIKVSPDMIPDHWIVSESFGPANLTECWTASRNLHVAFSVPQDEFVAMHDVDYPFEIVAVSDTGEEERVQATLTVMATPASRLRHLAQFAQESKAITVQNDVNSKLDAIANSVEKALAFHELEQAKAVKNVLGATVNKTLALDHAVAAQVGIQINTAEALQLWDVSHEIRDGVGVVVEVLP